MRKGRTASTTFISASNGQEVLIYYVPPVALWLNLPHKVNFLLWVHLHPTVLLGLRGNLVLDGMQWEWNFFSNWIRVSCQNTCLLMIGKSVPVAVSLLVAIDSNFLFNGKSDSGHLQVALWVVKSYHRSAKFVWLEYVFLEIHIYFAYTLVDTAPCCDFPVLCFVNVHHFLLNRLSYSHNLFVLH